jgi:hypothetical protein
MLVLPVFFVGVRVMLAVTLCAAMAVGLLAFGKVPGVWSGTPLPVKVRWVLLQLVAAVDVRFSDAMNTDELMAQATPAVLVLLVVVPVVVVPPVVPVSVPLLVDAVGVTVMAAEAAL